MEVTYDVDLPAAFETEHACSPRGNFSGLLDAGAIIEILLRHEAEERQAYFENLRGL